MVHSFGLNSVPQTALTGQCQIQTDWCLYWELVSLIGSLWSIIIAYLGCARAHARRPWAFCTLWLVLQIEEPLGIYYCNISEEWLQPISCPKALCLHAVVTQERLTLQGSTVQFIYIYTSQTCIQANRTYAELYTQVKFPHFLKRRETTWSFW